MLDQLFRDTGHIGWFPCEYITVGPKEVDERAFLFVSKSCPIKAVFDGSPSCSWIVLTHTLSGGFGAERFIFFVGISIPDIPDAEYCWAVVSTSSAVFDSRLVEA